MPTYDYECTACGHRFEKFQPMTARAIRKCPSCGQRAVRRLIGTGAWVIFKGSGFYQTDYRSESYKKAAEKDKAAGSSSGKDSGGEKKPSTGGEAKAATKSTDTAAEPGKKD